MHSFSDNWYSKYFSEDAVSPYSSDAEAADDILCLVDIYLNLAFKYKDDLDDQPEMRGVVITPAECEYALGSRTLENRLKKQTDQNRRLEEKNQAACAWRHLYRRGTDCADSRIWQLIKKFRLGKLETLGFFLALCLEYDRKYERLFGYLQDNVSERLPTLGLLYTLYELFDEKALLSPQSSLFSVLLEDIKEEQNYSRLARPLKVRQSVLNYIFDGNSAFLSDHLEKWAVKVPIGFCWDDLIIQEEQKDLLKQICSRVRFRKTVGKEWGFEKKFSYGHGVSAVFYGSPGTGKTMAAQIIASELHLDLYKIDFSSLLSKYIGETEKNLRDLFYEAQKINAVLLFDEADGLFSKRTEIRSSNDRYANTETGYLLQKFEEYDGICILTTNFMGNMDEAFRRRFTFLVRFQPPDEKLRLRIWQSMLPGNVPLSGALDFVSAAKNFELTGSEIREVLIQAAYMAASENSRLSNEHLQKALKLILDKYGRKFLFDKFSLPDNL